MVRERRRGEDWEGAIGRGRWGGGNGEGGIPQIDMMECIGGHRLLG